MRPQFLPSLFAPGETQSLIAAVPAQFERRETYIRPT